MSRAALLPSIPHIELVRSRLRFCAMHDAIVAPDMRSFEFHPKWGRGQQMGAFKDGEGNFFFAWFSPKGAVLRGFDHDSVMSPFRHDPPARWPGLFDGLPPALAYALKEPAFAQDEVTFALWNTGNGWRAGKAKLPKGKDPDGAERLLGCLQRDFARWRKQYYGTPRSEAISVLWWDRKPITREVVLALNPDADLAAVRAEAKLLGWQTDLATAQASKPRKPPPPASAQRKAAKPKARSFGAAEFVVRCEPTRVRMIIGGKTVVAEAKIDVYEELFDLVKARLVSAKRTGA